MLEIMRLYISRVLMGQVSRLLSLELFTAVAVAIAVISAKYATTNPFIDVDVPLLDFAKVLVTYGALGMSACLTTLALAARWTSGDFNEFFRENAAGRDRKSCYSAMLFQISWTAITHWLAFVIGLIVSLLTPKKWLLLPHSGGSDAETYCGVLGIFVATYCSMLFLSTLFAVSTLCMIRKDFMDRADTNK